jgi:thiol-disulfide isomerase/thioredoxin
MTGMWLVSYVLLWVTVLALGFAVVALLRQIGVLHTRVAPMGVHFAGEGPELDRPAPPVGGVDYRDSSFTLLAFTSQTCEICETLKPGLQRLNRSYAEIDLTIIDHDTDPSTFSDFKVRSTPYLIAVDADGIVRSRGVANTLDQAEEMLAEVLAGPPVDPNGAEASTSPVAQTESGRPGSTPTDQGGPGESFTDTADSGPLPGLTAPEQASSANERAGQ